MKTKPVFNSDDLKLVELFDLEDIQKLQDAFSNATGVASLITEPDGTPITRPSGFCDLCNKVIRKTEVGLKHCKISDSIIGQPSDGPRIQHCLSGGLVDAGASIIVQGKHVGNWLIGQVLLDDIDIDELLGYADVIGVDRAIYKQELLKVRRMPKEQFEGICHFLYLNAQYISQYALQNILLSQELVRKKLTEMEIRQLVIERTKQLEDMNCELEEANALLEEEIGCRELAENELHNLNNNLEKLIEDRTSQLDKINHELKQTNTRLEKYKILSENANDIMLFVDKEGKILEVNDTALKVYGYTIEEFLTMSVFDLRHSNNKVEVINQMNLADHDGIVFETIHYKKDGTSFYVEVSSQGTYLGNNRVLLSIVRDITERKAAELQVLKAKEAAEAANLAKSQFLANMSHEIRTPMNGILGFLQILELSDLTKDQKECIETIKYSAESLTNIINDILDLSKIEAGKTELENIVFDLHKTVECSIEAFVLLANKKGVNLILNRHSNVPKFVKGDPTKLRQLLINIINNAVKFTTEGQINVDINLINQSDDSNTLLFKISDTGIGIAEEDLCKVFKPFSQADASLTRKFGGTGLGLAICKRIATLMKGDIQVESILGKGSTFSFNITLDKAVNIEENKDDAVQKGISANHSDIKILLAEDNEINVRLFKKLLKLNGYSCDVVENGEEAINAYLNNDYDIIFMDCQMPVLDGYEAARRIRELESDLKHPYIVAITAYAMKGDKEKCLEAGMDHYLSKPLDIEKVLEIINLSISNKDVCQEGIRL